MTGVFLLTPVFKLLDSVDMAEVAFYKKKLNLILIGKFSSTKQYWLRYQNFYCFYYTPMKEVQNSMKINYASSYYEALPSIYYHLI